MQPPDSRSNVEQFEEKSSLCTQVDEQPRAVDL